VTNDSTENQASAAMTVDPASITIPAGLLPKDGRFGSGPSKVRAEQLSALAALNASYLGTSHRQAPVRAQVARLRTGLRELFSLPEGHEVILGNGGSTAFWDAATFGLIESRAQFASFGEFGAKFASAAKSAPHLAEQTIITGTPGTAAYLQHEDGIDAYCSPHNETSTGVAITPSRVSGADNALLLIDATSAAAALPVNIPEVDAYYFGPQKAFGSDGGLWVALMSPAALERIERISKSGRWTPAFLDLQIAVDNSRLEQTYNTPSLTTIALMAEQTDWFLSQGGLAWSTGRCSESSQLLYTWAENREWAEPFVKDPAERSAVVVTIDIDQRVSVDDVTKVLRRHGIVDVDSYRKLGRNQLRVAVFPAVDPADVQAFTESVDFVVGALLGSA
jgi:phosphoserine aminotransferase